MAIILITILSKIEGDNNSVGNDTNTNYNINNNDNNIINSSGGDKNNKIIARKNYTKIEKRFR